MSAPKLIEIYADTRGVGTCNGKDCGRKILWATVVTSGRKMCFDDLDLVALRTRHEPSTRRTIETVDLDNNHWRTCPNARTFGKGR